MARSPLTPARRARLEKLATYLESLPKRYKHFDMGDYLGISQFSDLAIQYARHNGGVAQCGTVACAAGHGPAAGILVPPRYIAGDWRKGVNWEGYCTLFVGKITFDYAESTSRLYRWCFGGEWSDTDNHHWGAAARIRYALANGGPPPKYDSCGESPPRSIRKLYAPYRIDAKAKADA